MLRPGLVLAAHGFHGSTACPHSAVSMGSGGPPPCRRPHRRCRRHRAIWRRSTRPPLPRWPSPGRRWSMAVLEIGADTTHDGIAVVHGRWPIPRRGAGSGVNAAMDTGCRRVVVPIGVMDSAPALHERRRVQESVCPSRTPPGCLRVVPARPRTVCPTTQNEALLPACTRSTEVTAAPEGSTTVVLPPPRPRRRAHPSERPSHWPSRRIDTGPTRSRNHPDPGPRPGWPRPNALVGVFPMVRGGSP